MHREQIEAWRTLDMPELVKAWLAVLRSKHPGTEPTLSELGRILKVNKSTVMRWTNGQKPDLNKLRDYVRVIELLGKDGPSVRSPR